ncbi:protein of unknown function [Agreia sp. COWG]|nr:protein of unknown function [Agreia sp. COWG]
MPTPSASAPSATGRLPQPVAKAAPVAIVRVARPPPALRPHPAEHVAEATVVLAQRLPPAAPRAPTPRRPADRAATQPAPPHPAAMVAARTALVARDAAPRAKSPRFARTGGDLKNRCANRAGSADLLPFCREARCRSRGSR